MKKLLVFSLLMWITLSAFSQCNTFFPLREGVKYQYDLHDKKDKVTMRINQWLKNVSGSGSTMKATMVQETIDAKKDKPLASSETEWTCEDGTLHFAVNNIGMDGGASMASGVTVELSGDQMDIPSDMQVGQTLKDLTYQIKMGMSGMTIMNRSFTVTDRKVEAEEAVTTPAGTFNCYKVSFTTTSQGGIGAGTFKSIVWYSKDTGMVKTETYSEKGVLQSKQVLSKIEK